MYYIGIRLNSIINEYRVEALGPMSKEKVLKIKKNYILIVPYETETEYLKAYEVLRSKKMVIQ